MLIFTYNDVSVLLPYFIFFVSVWSFFIFSTHVNINSKPDNSDKLKNTITVKKLHYSVYIEYIYFCVLLFLFSFMFSKTIEKNIFWNQLSVSNFSSSYVCLVLIFILLIFALCNTLKYNNIVYNVDFFFCTSNIVLFLTFVFYSNTLFTILFVIEIISVLTFYMFSVSKFWYKENNLIKKKNSSMNNRRIPKSYINMLFFNYWSTFFSSVLLFYSIANIHLIFNSSEYLVLDFLQKISVSTTFSTGREFNFFVWITFFLGFLVKIGMTPAHLFKIETYKGLPFISLLFYTGLFFFVYISYISIFISFIVPFIKFILSSVLYLFIISGAAYTLTIIFDISALKSFFAYSTIINTVLFISAVVGV